MQGLRIAVLAEGSRGDCQPYIALALRLQQEGFTVQMLSNSNHSEITKKLGIDFVSVFTDSEEQLQSEGMVAAMKVGDVFKFMDTVGELGKENYPGEFDRCWAALGTFKPQMVMYGVLSNIIGELYCKVNKIPGIPAFLGIYFYTSEVAPLGLPTTFGFVNRFLWKQVFKAFLQTGLEKLEVAKEKLGREDIMDMMAITLDETIEEVNDPVKPKLIGSSAHVLGPAKDVTCPNVHCTGWWILDQSHQVERFKAGDPNFGGTEKQLIEDFLKASPAPVYLGWGSMMAVSPEFMTELAVSTLSKTQKRGIILRGWSGLAPELLKDGNLKSYAKENVLFIKSAPHEWLLPQCALCVSHGGSGTTAASMRSGKPAVITPVFLDQYDFAKSVERLGVGVGTCQFKDVTPDILAAAVNKCLLNEEIPRNAAALGEKLRAEDGAGNAIEVLKTFIQGPLQSGAWLQMEEARQRRFVQTRSQGLFGSLACCQPRGAEDEISAAVTTDKVP